MLRVRHWALASTVLCSLLAGATAHAQDASGGGGGNDCGGSDVTGSTKGVTRWDGQSSRGGWNEYLANVTGSENRTGNSGMTNSLGFVGNYQMGKEALIDAGWVQNTGGTSNFSNYQWTSLANQNGVYSMTDFKNNPTAQTAAFTAYEQKNWSYIQNMGADKLIGQINPFDGKPVTASGLMQGMQFGPARMRAWVNNGMQCNASTSDGNGICVGDYVSRGNGFDISSVTGSQDPNVSGGGSGGSGGGGGGGGGSGGGGSGGGSNPCDNNKQDSTEMTSKACEKTMPIIEGIQCERFPASLQSFCQQYKPYLMTRQGCQEAEQWAKEQVESSGGGGDTTPQKQKDQPPQEPKGTGSAGGEWPSGSNVLDNGDDGMPDSNGSTPEFQPHPSQATGGGPGGTPNGPVTGQPYSGGPVPVGKIKPGNWKEACKKQTKHDGASVWSYVLWCSQLKVDPPRRGSGNNSPIAGNLGYSGPGSTAGPSGSGVGSSDGTSGSGSGGGTNSKGEANGQDVQNPARSTNTADKASDNECVQKIKNAGVTFSFEGYDVAQKVIAQGKCHVPVGLTVSKWATASMNSPVPHINCSEAYVVNQWVKALGVGKVTHAGSYSCRGMRGGSGSNPNKLSYHSYGDAFDVAGMDGQKFNGTFQGLEGRAQTQACSMFDTVLTGRYYRQAYTHFHVEMNHAKGICK